VKASRNALIAGGLVVAVVVAVLAALQLADSKGAGGDTSSPAPGYSVAVVRDGKVLARLTLADLRALPQAHVVIDEKEQDGPLVTDVLDKAAAGPVATVTVVGAGLRDSGKLRVGDKAVIDSLVIDFSDRGTVKVCSPKLPWSEWVRDVTEIRVT
jgi:hypothetical protein